MLIHYLTVLWENHHLTVWFQNNVYTKLQICFSTIDDNVGLNTS